MRTESLFEEGSVYNNDILKHMQRELEEENN